MKIKQTASVELLRRLTCGLFKGSHLLAACENFQKLSSLENREHVKKNELCFCCLWKGYGIYMCRKKTRCLIAGCSKLYNTSLRSSSNDTQHLPEEKYNKSKNEEENKCKNEKFVSSCYLRPNIQVLVTISEQSQSCDVKIFIVSTSSKCLFLKKY